MVVQHNMTAANANRMLGSIVTNQAKATEKLSSGYQINRAGDNAAGLAISEKMRGQIRGLDQASSNAQDGISLIQTAEGALTETHSILQRMRELAVQASSDTNTDDDRTQIQNEIDALTSEVDRIANTTEFNTKKLLDGSQRGAVNEKAGTLQLEGNFSNSNVSVNVTKNNADKAAFSDVIRLEITQDFTKGQSTKSTQKLSDDMITKINSMITSGSAVALDKVLQDSGSATSITNGGYNANNSIEENIKGALDAAKAEATTQVSNANLSKSAVTTNDDNMDSIIKKITDYAKTTKATAGVVDTTFLNDGITSSDIKAAVVEYVDALTETGTPSAAGKSDRVTAAENKIASLFNTSAADSITTSAKTTATTDLVYKESNNVDTSNTNIQIATIDGSSTAVKINTIATNVKTALTNYAKGLATTKVADSINNAKVEQINDIVDTLKNTDLVKAVVDYKKEAGVDTSTMTDAAKADQAEKVSVAKAKLDKLNTDSSVVTVNDLFGSTDNANMFKIGSNVDDNNNLTINLKSKSGEDTVVTIANADKLKAGDTILLTSQEMVESKQATVGKEALRLQIGSNAGQEVALGINSMKANDLNIVQTKEGKEGQALNVTNQADASLAVNAYDQAIKLVSTERAKMGAMQNRLEHTISNLDTSAENLQTAESRIRDVDMASEMVNYSKNNILQQAAQSMLAQANQSNQGVLSLLR